MAPPADESENRSPVNFAKLGERFARTLRVASRIRAGKDHAHRVVTKRSGLCPWGERAFDFRGTDHLICPIVKQAQISHKFVCRLAVMAPTNEKRTDGWLLVC